MRAEAAEPEDGRDWSGLELSSGLHQRLCQAAGNRQVTQMEACIQEMEQFSPEAADLAAHLRELRKQHRMGTILSLMENIQHG